MSFIVGKRSQREGQENIESARERRWIRKTLKEIDREKEDRDSARENYGVRRCPTCICLLGCPPHERGQRASRHEGRCLVARVYARGVEVLHELQGLVRRAVDRPAHHLTTRWVCVGGEGYRQAGRVRGKAR